MRLGKHNAAKRAWQTYALCPRHRFYCFHAPWSLRILASRPYSLQVHNSLSAPNAIIRLRSNVKCALVHYSLWCISWTTYLASPFLISCVLISSIPWWYTVNYDIVHIRTLHKCQFFIYNLTLNTLISMSLFSL